jgi:tetratricopeptide (TPR) repeat protein
MKNIQLLIALILCLLPTTRLMAVDQMDIDPDNASTPSAAATVVSTPVPTEAATPASAPLTTTAAPSPAVTANPGGNSAEVLELTPVAGQGMLKMRDVYNVGISYYKKQDFAKAIRYLKQALQIHDPYTLFFYYAEANAMLGVIYQFHIIDKKLAYEYYSEALRIDPETATAKKHIRELSHESGKK